VNWASAYVSAQTYSLNDVLSEDTVLVEDEAALEWILLGIMIKQEQWIEKVKDPQEYEQNLSSRFSFSSAEETGEQVHIISSFALQMNLA
jgi:hypothetical protein